MQAPLLACAECGWQHNTHGPCTACGSWKFSSVGSSQPLVGGHHSPATAPRTLLDVEREKRRVHLRRAADLPAGWTWSPALPLLDGHLNVTPNYQGLLASIFARFDVDQDGLLSLPEINALQMATGGEHLSAEHLRDVCLTAMPDFDPMLDCGLSAVGLANLSLQSLLSSPTQEAATYARLGFVVAPSALPTGAQRASFAQLRAAEHARRSCMMCGRVGCTTHTPVAFT